MKQHAAFSSLFIILTVIFLIGQKTIQIPQVFAFTMSSGNYILEMGNLDSFSGSAKGGDTKISFTSGEASQGLAQGKNNKVKLGFQYIHPLRGFTFSLSQPLIDFGILSPTNPVTRNSILTINNRSSKGYSVSASENHALQAIVSGQTIPDTTCDNGSCTHLTAGVWNSTLTYGFGYRCDQITVPECASGFSNSQSYKQFADAAKREAPEAVMHGGTSGSNKQVKITYKVNISGSQPPGSYSNVITYIAVPTF